VVDDASHKKGPRLDEDLKKPTRGGEDARRPEAEIEDDRRPLVDRPDLERPPGDIVIEPDVEERSQIARFLNPSVFPADRQALLASAEGNFAPDWVIERLRRLPDGETFVNVQAVWVALGGPTERRA
jgi:hypothetical protein